MTFQTYDEICSTISQLVPKLEKILLPNLDPDLLEDAWQEYTGDHRPEQQFKTDELLNEGFLPWFYFNFRDDLNDYKSMVDIYREHAKFISSGELKLFEALEKSTIGIWSVIGRTPGESLVLKNMLTSMEVTISERRASQEELKDRFIFARVATLDGISFFHSCCPVPLETYFFDDLDAFIEEWGEATDDGLRDYLVHEYFFERYFERIEPPVIVNSEGHRLSPIRATYELTDLKTAVEQLCRLNHLVPKEEQLRDAKYYKSGDVRTVELDWLDPRSKKKAKVLGFLRLDSSRLILETNSEERFFRFESWMKKNLKGLYRQISIEEPKLDEPGTPARDIPDEIKEKIMRDYLYSHYDQWVKEKIPALGHKRPIDLVKTIPGRKQVEKLIEEMEKGPSFPGQPDDVFSRLRSKLGLK